ncbi:FMN-dependent NADH-azoreductase [Mucilaginibacter pallidiroseus]|uniref:FMN dependent NADH:quinone oxidoreductase n=1 Tax=Mucilaginibacter pallidiroseus TaxID=2599295 RepID=A0A563TYD8_9SPHI|nr:NAD(P)H-dependent oxidoreductase [Mucilaginibacter pallidiroseus]TWR24374.1 FMN-dependent NADH-azoreductase [Mucilaginibacter pallidiroseus]
MKNILHIISSPRGDSSFSIKLGKAIVEKIQNAYPGSSVTEYDLISKNFPHLEEHHVRSFYTPAEQRSPEATEALAHSDEAISAIRNADYIVIGAPLYNFGIHSSLKAWIDHITRIGETFNYTENGPEGLIHGKKVYIAMSSGGVYSHGEATGFDFVSPYLKTILGFLGLTDVSVFRIEGTAIEGIKETAVEKGIDSIVIS